MTDGEVPPQRLCICDADAFGRPEAMPAVRLRMTDVCQRSDLALEKRRDH